MGRRIYVLFDYPSDMLIFSEMKSRCLAEDSDNYFYTADYDAGDKEINEKIYQGIMSSSLVIVLVNSNSKYLGGKYNFGIETAVKSQKPLVVVNMNHERSLDIENCPMSLRGKFALHISNDSSIINFAIKEWPSYYKENKGKNLHSMYLDDTIYKHFNL